MNDTQELRFGAEIMGARLARAADDPEIPADMRAAFGDLVPWFSPDAVVSGGMRCFAACFCDNGDALNQWYGYAGGTGGFAIGFDWEAVAGHTWTFHPHPAPGAPPWESQTALQPVAYGIKDAEARVDGAVTALVERRGGGVLIRDGRPDRFHLAVGLFRVVATIKHDGFAPEREWRLFSPSEVQYPADLRETRFGPAHYVEMVINLQGDNDICSHRTIADLVVGPGKDQENQVILARELLEERGHDPDVVRASNTPLR
ncbi:hypothetical protein FBY28_0542 [Arthrobacter sp. SLBN-53]|nr:hypothetical protein FBY28_0542 [Arthrobacter sp. SLBN-53]